MRRLGSLLTGALLLFAAACDGVDQENVSDRVPRTPPPIASSGGVANIPTRPTVAAGDCMRGGERERASAQSNAVSRRNLLWSPFGRQEYGWETYAPRIGQTIGTLCPPDTPGFAQALARWQAAKALPADGALRADHFDLMKTDWHRQRPYIALRGDGVCPDPPPESALAVARSDEGYGGKVVMMRPAVLSALRRMQADARAQVPEIARDADMLKVFSAYRDPHADAARCAREGNCDGIRRASCSIHRTGLALDLVVGQAPGHPVDSTADPNRLAMSQTAAYRWLVQNAGRYGFVNYAFEPWHWEYVAEPIEVAPGGYRLSPDRARVTTETGTEGGGGTFGRGTRPR
jgi:D-alanyl-D-alanine dipeptidase